MVCENVNVGKEREREKKEEKKYKKEALELSEEERFFFVG